MLLRGVFLLLSLLLPLPSSLGQCLAIQSIQIYSVPKLVIDGLFELLQKRKDKLIKNNIAIQ